MEPGTEVNVADLGIRERLEALERETLSSFAMRSAESKGRTTREPLDPVRTAFQRDRDRIIHSKAFRRLKHKTQVLFAPHGDHYRTRMTHTLEVVQIARTIGRSLRLNEDLIEAIGLGHDLGHTPFGHSGERALDALSQKYLGKPFRHYEQSLRVVDVLENNGKGLNLTHEVRDGILFHSKGRKDLTEGKPPDTLEGQCIRIADRAAYLNHDLDDAVRGGLLEPEEVPAHLLETLGRTHSERIARIVWDIILQSWEKPAIAPSETLRKAMDALKDFLFEKVYLREEQRVEWQKAQRLLTALFDYLMEEGVPEREAPRDDTERAQAVIDYIAGMTDHYAMWMFQEVFVPHRWGY